MSTDYSALRRQLVAAEQAHCADCFGIIDINGVLALLDEIENHKREINLMIEGLHDQSIRIAQLEAALGELIAGGSMDEKDMLLARAALRPFTAVSRAGPGPDAHDAPAGGAGSVRGTPEGDEQ